MIARRLAHISYVSQLEDFASYENTRFSKCNDTLCLVYPPLVTTDVSEHIRTLVIICLNDLRALVALLLLLLRLFLFLFLLLPLPSLLLGAFFFVAVDKQ